MLCCVKLVSLCTVAKLTDQCCVFLFIDDGGDKKKKK
jgi:hypothetical protein